MPCRVPLKGQCRHIWFCSHAWLSSAVTSLIHFYDQEMSNTSKRTKCLCNTFRMIHLLQKNLPLTLLSLCSISDLAERKCTAALVFAKSVPQNIKINNLIPLRVTLQLLLCFYSLSMRLKPVILAEGCKHWAKAYTRFIKGSYRLFSPNNCGYATGS